MGRFSRERLNREQKEREIGRALGKAKGWHDAAEEARTKEPRESEPHKINYQGLRGQGFLDGYPKGRKAFTEHQKKKE